MSDTSRNIKSVKKELRARILERNAALDPSYTTEADRRIRELLLSLPEYRKAGTVFCFVGTDHEIDTVPFLDRVLRDGKTLCVPLCRGRRRMEARRITSLAQLQKGSYGIPEPDPDTTPIVQPVQIDLSVIPCVTCSHAGVRLGHGGGYYDTCFRELLPGSAGIRASGNTGKDAGMTAVMICRERLITENIPQEAHDLVFPFVVTEAGIFAAGRQAHVRRSSGFLQKTPGRG